MRRARWRRGRAPSGPRRRGPSSRSGTARRRRPARMSVIRTRRLDRAARRLDRDQIALGDAERRRRPPALSSTHTSGAAACELRRAAGLRAGVEVVDGAPGGQQQRVLVARASRASGEYVGGVQERAAVAAPWRGTRPRCARRPVIEVLAERLRVLGVGVEQAVGVEPLGAVRRVLGARPLDAAAAAQPVVASCRCSRTAARASTPSRPRTPTPASCPLDQRRAVAVAEVHPLARSRGRCRGRRAPRRAARRPARRGAPCGRRW